MTMAKLHLFMPGIDDKGINGATMQAKIYILRDIPCCPNDDKLIVKLTFFLVSSSSHMIVYPKISDSTVNDILPAIDPGD